MQNYRFICTALALYITVASFAGHKRTHPDDQESSKSTKRARTGTTQHDLNKKMLAATVKNQWEVVYALLELGANIEATTTTTPHGLTPLHFAARDGHCHAVETLIQRGANINATTQAEFTPLHFAAVNNKVQAIETLIQHRARIEATTQYGISPLHLAVNYGHSQAAEALIQHGAHPIPHAENVWAPLDLYYRFQLRSLQTTVATPFLQYLIKVSLDATADNGNTILHHLLLQKDLNDSLLYHILHHPSFTAFNAEHKNMFGYNALHICTIRNQFFLQRLSAILILGKTPEEIKRLKKATTPCGDTVYSLIIGYQNTLPHNSWTPLMHTVFSIPSLTAQSEALLKQRLKSTDDPAYVTDECDSALSVARCEEVKNMIREDIRQKRRAQVSTYLMDEHQQPKVLADLQLQFAGTYEPSSIRLGQRLF